MNVEFKENSNVSINIWKYFIDVVLLILFASLILSIFIIAYESRHLSFEFTTAGIEKFISLYLISFKISGAFIALLTIKVSIIRINQSEEALKRTNFQLKNYKESENLKNYFLHRKEFKEYIQETPLIKSIKTDDFIELYNIWNTLYKCFFYTGYKDFNAKLNDEVIKTINSYLNEIRTSPLNLTQLPQVELNEIIRLKSLALPQLHEIIDILVDIKLKALNSEINYTSYEEIEKVKLKTLVEVFTTKQLYEYVLSFDGLEIKDTPQFNTNYANYINFLKTNNYDSIK
jgi:hypothetical protein